jgi:hypothetical protein
MQRNILFQFVGCAIVLFCVVLNGGHAFTATRKTADPAPMIQDGERPLVPPMALSPIVEAGDTAGVSSPVLLMTPSTRSAGIPIGLTTMEVQFWHALGRRVALDYQTPPNVHLVWTNQDNPNFFDPSLSVAYQVFNTAGGYYVLSAGGVVVSDLPYSWIASGAAYPDNRFAFACLRNGWANSVAAAYTEADPGLAIFLRNDVFPDPDSSWYFEDLITPFPVVEVQNGTDTVVYILAMAHDIGVDEPVGLVLYRKVNNGEFDGGKYFESGVDFSRDIVARQNTDSVAIVAEDYRFTGEDGPWFDLDIYYMLSTDQGMTWGPKVSVTNYTADSLWRSDGHFSALWDTDGELHIIWSARELIDSVSGYWYRCRLLHWSSINGQASVISEARYSVDCSIGKWYMNISSPSLSQCNGNLYALWTQFGDEGILDDCSDGEFANGDLYMAASDDWGVTWDTAVNLTNTRTPHCLPGECESDHWSSMARYGIPYQDAFDTLDIVYINDKDAGAAFNGRGTWTINPIMHMRVPCRDVVHLPRIAADPEAIGYPAVVDTQSAADTNITIINAGNGDLQWEATINYIDGEEYNWLTVNPSSGLIQTQPSNTQVVTVSFTSADLPGDPSFWNAEIVVSASDYPGIIPSLAIPVQLIVASDLHQPKSDTLDTGCKALACFNTGRYGGNSRGYALNIPGDCDTVDQYPDAEIYIYDGSPLISWINGDEEIQSYTAVHRQTMAEPGTFFPDGNMVTTPEAGYDKIEYTISTTDSVFMVDVTLYAPNDGSHCFIVGQNDFYLRDGVQSAGGVYLGQILDWDIPSDSSVDNGSGFDAARNVIWQYGGEYHTDNQGSCDIMEYDRLGGIALLSHSGRNAWTEPNAGHLSGSAFSPDYLYLQMSTLSGYHIYEPGYGQDPMVDLHTGMTFDSVDMQAGEVYSYTYALLTTNEGEADFLGQLDAAVDWVMSQGTICCASAPGDANADSTINIGDAVYLISYIFKGGPPPTPYEIASGDSNGDCAVNVGDAVHIINYIFKGGPPPVSVSAWIDGCGLPLR